MYGLRFKGAWQESNRGGATVGRRETPCRGALPRLAGYDVTTGNRIGLSEGQQWPRMGKSGLKWPRVA